MSQIAATQIPKPTDEQAFERACVVLFMGVLNDPNVQTNGRRGQRQHGVDIFGFRDQDATHPVGVQCKLKGPDIELTEREVREEVEKALTFTPALREYIIVSTASDDGHLQRIARELTIKAAEGGRRISINVWGWQTLEQRINEHGRAMQAFDPSYGVFAKEQSEQLHKIIDQQSIVIREIGNIRSDVGGVFSARSLPGGSTTETNALEAALDAEIDRYRDTLNHGKPKTALSLYDSLLSRIQASASGRILFRVKANIGHCYFMLGDNARAAHWLNEAFAHAPTEPKAIANKVLALLLLDKFRDAYEYGIKELEKDPTNKSLPSFVVQAMARCPDLDLPLLKIPEPLRDLEEVQVGYVDFLRYRNRIPDWWIAAREASAAHPDQKMLLQYRAEADLDEVVHSDEFKRGARLSSETKEKIEASAAILLERWEERRFSENPSRPDGVAACCNLLIAYTYLEKTTIALPIAKQAISLVPDDKELLDRAAIIALESGNFEFAATLLPRLSDSSNARLVQFQFYAHTANWEKLIEVTNRADLFPDHERPLVATMGRLATLMIGIHNRDEQHEKIKRIATETPDDVRACVALADFAQKLNFKDVSDDAYKRALATAERGVNLIGRYMLARTAGRRSDWRAVIQLLDGNIETNFGSEELSLLTTAFVNEDPTRKRAVSFFTEIDPSIRDTPFYLTAFGFLQSKRGDLRAAEKAFDHVLSVEPENVTALRSLFSIYLRQERSDRIALMKARMQGLELKKLKGPAYEKMALTHILRDIGEGKRALEWAHEIVQYNRNDPQVVMAYFGLIIGRGDVIEIPPANEVAVDTWISIKNNLGEKLNLIIENGVDRPAEGFYSPTHAFVAPALGLKVGESFTQSRQIGKPETWTILEIKHKFLHALHDIMETFNVRFPEERGFYRVTTQEGDISPILDQVKSHSERSQSIIDLYFEKKIPLAFIAAMTHTEVIKFALGITQSNRDIVACYGNEVERKTAESLVRAYANKGAVLDGYTVWCAETIGVLPALKSLFGTLLVPRSAIDELAALQHENDDTRPQMSVSYRNGQYFREEMSAEQIKSRQNTFLERRKNIEHYCEVAPVDVPDTASELARGLIEQLPSRILDPAFLARERDKLLLCDDLYFRQVAQQACAAKGAFLQAAINVAYAKRFLDDAGVANAVVGLAALRHSHVALTPANLLTIAKEDNTDRQIKFRAATEFIGTKAADIYSHVRVTILFLNGVWGLRIPDLTKEACSGIILEQLLRFRNRDYREIIAIMRSEFGYSPASGYLERWIRGHFLSV